MKRSNAQRNTPDRPLAITIGVTVAGLLAVVLIALVVWYFTTNDDSNTNGGNVNAVVTNAPVQVNTSTLKPCEDVTGREVCEDRDDCIAVDYCSCNTRREKTIKCGDRDPGQKCVCDFGGFSRCEPIDCFGPTPTAPPPQLTNSTVDTSCASITSAETCQERTDCLRMDACPCRTEDAWGTKCGSPVPYDCDCADVGFQECVDLDCSVSPITVTALPTPTTREDCEVQNGRWGAYIQAEVEECYLPYDDAGDSCIDETRCEGGCLAEISQEQYELLDASADVLTDITGRCTRYRYETFGCNAWLTNGEVRASSARTSRNNSAQRRSPGEHQAISC